MSTPEIYKSIREIVESALPGSRVLLFGSRARGDHNVLSDYDLMVITPSTCLPKEKISLSTKINHSIVKTLKIPVDLLINSEREIKEKQNLPGHIVRTVLREGVYL